MDRRATVGMSLPTPTRLRDSMVEADRTCLQTRTHRLDLAADSTLEACLPTRILQVAISVEDSLRAVTLEAGSQAVTFERRQKRVFGRAMCDLELLRISTFLFNGSIDLFFDERWSGWERTRQNEFLFRSQKFSCFKSNRQFTKLSHIQQAQQFL